MAFRLYTGRNSTRNSRPPSRISSPLSDIRKSLERILSKREVTFAPPSIDGTADQDRESDPDVDLEAADPSIRPRNEKRSQRRRIVRFPPIGNPTTLLKRGFHWLLRTRRDIRIEKKIGNPWSCRCINYNIHKLSNLTGWCLRFFLTILWCIFIGLLHDRLPFICGPSASTIEEAAAARFLFQQQIFRPNIILFFEALAAGGGSFAMTQGFISLRASRERMERVAHTATTVAAAVLKSAKPGDMRREDLQLNVFNCLALVTAYPVCLANRIRGNTHDPCVVTLCNRAAKRLQQLRPIEKDDPGTRSVTNTSSVTFQEGTRNEMEHFFEILSLQLEREFRTSSRSKLPSIAPQRVMYNIRNHLDDLADICDFGTFRTPLIRENVDLMAMIGRESSVYAYSDNVKPIAFLWTFDIVARVLCLSLPIQTCTTLAWSMMGRAALEIAGISVITATALTILNEIWGLWDPYAKGVNIYSWTLGVAREIDAMLNDVYDSDRDRDKGLPLRKHGYDAWKIPSDKPRPSPADEELPRVVDELYEINHHLEALRRCREGI